MELSYIRENWRQRPEADAAASIRAWDSVADDYLYDGDVSFEKDSFLQFVAEKAELTKDMSVLDVGCGAGAYSAALAERVGHVDGVDFSPRMVENAGRYASENSIQNVRFLERDWHRCDGGEFAGKYDLVFAHTTPAVADYETFIKMVGASRRYGFFCKPARRTDKVFDGLRQTLGLPSRNGDDSTAYIFDILWHMGMEPEVRYEKAVWKSSKPLEEAAQWQIGRLKGIYHVTAAEEAAVREYLRSIAADGMVRDETHTTLVNFFWEAGR